MKEINILTPEKVLRALQMEHDTINQYEHLKKLAETKTDKDIIREIIKDEKLHFDNFAKLYLHITGSPPYEHLRMETPITFNTYNDGLRDAFFSELEAFEYYRDVLLLNMGAMGHNSFWLAMTDEDEHAHRFNYIMMKNCCYGGDAERVGKNGADKAPNPFDEPSIPVTGAEQDINEQAVDTLAHILEKTIPTNTQAKKIDEKQDKELAEAVNAQSVSAIIPESVKSAPIPSDTQSTSQASAQRLRLRELWSQNVWWTRNALISILAKLPDAQSIVDRLMKVPIDLSEMFERFGSSAQETIRELLSEQTMLLGKLFTAFRDNDEARVLELDTAVYKNADDLADALHSINPQAYDKNAWHKMLYTYLDLSKDQAMSRLRGSFNQEIMAFDNLEELAMLLADETAKGL